MRLAGAGRRNELGALGTRMLAGVADSRLPVVVEQRNAPVGNRGKLRVALVYNSKTIPITNSRMEENE